MKEQGLSKNRSKTVRVTGTNKGSKLLMVYSIVDSDCRVRDVVILFRIVGKNLESAHCSWGRVEDDGWERKNSDTYFFVLGLPIPHFHRHIALSPHFIRENTQNQHGNLTNLAISVHKGTKIILWDFEKSSIFAATAFIRPDRNCSSSTCQEHLIGLHMRFVCWLNLLSRVLLFSLVGHFDTEIDAICCTFCYARLFDRSILTKENFVSDVPFHSLFKKAGVSLCWMPLFNASICLLFIHSASLSVFFRAEITTIEKVSRIMSVF